MSSASVPGRWLPEERYWEDLVVGDRLRGPAVTMTEAHLVTWAGLTGDFVPLHLDAHASASGRFGRRIAHGPLTLGLGLMTQAGYFANAVAWLGLEDVKALLPVFLSDTVHPEAVLEAARTTHRPEHGIWTLAYMILNQDLATVMSFTTSLMVRRHPTEGAAGQVDSTEGTPAAGVEGA